MAKVKLKKPHSGGQMDIYKDNTRFKIVACGRRFGKTELAKIQVLKKMVNAKHFVAYLAPTYKQLLPVWREFRHTFQPIASYISEQHKIIELPNGSRLTMWASESVENARGSAFHHVVVDEAAIIKNGKEVWDTIIRPALADYRGSADFLSTPRGRNYFHDLYKMGLDPNFPEFKSFKLPTTHNPFIFKEEIELARKTTPERFFKQEYLAEFLDDVGTVFRGVMEVSILPELEPYNSDFVFGIDFGRSNDYTVVSVIDTLLQKQVYMERFNKINWREQRSRIKELYDMWQPSTVIAEANSIGDVNIEELENEGVPIEPFHTTYTSKKPLIDGLSVALEKKELLLLCDQDQISELQAYEMSFTSHGNVRFEAPSGFHDDTVIALALAWHGYKLSEDLVHTSGGFRKLA